MNRFLKCTLEPYAEMIESMHKRSHTVTMMSWEMQLLQLFVGGIFKQSGTAQIQASLSFDRGVFYILGEYRILTVENCQVLSRVLTLLFSLRKL